MKKTGIYALIGVLILSGFVILLAGHAFSGNLNCTELDGCTSNYGCDALEWWSAPQCKINCIVGPRFCEKKQV
jgi:hypothetical protein